MTHSRMLRRAGGAACRRCWGGPLRCRSGQGAMTHRGVLGRAGCTGRWSGWSGLAAVLCNSRRGCSSEQEGKDGLHAGSPSSGRTFTTRIMPACMW